MEVSPGGKRLDRAGKRYFFEFRMPSGRGSRADSFKERPSVAERLLTVLKEGGGWYHMLITFFLKRTRQLLPHIVCKNVVDRSWLKSGKLKAISPEREKAKDLWSR